jgi:hypothetical protein
VVALKRRAILVIGRCSQARGGRLRPGHEEGFSQIGSTKGHAQPHADFALIPN